MTYVVLYDANVLYPMPTADTLVRVGVDSHAFHLSVRWTEEILNEVDEALGSRGGVEEDRIARRRQLICEAVPDCIVSGYEHGIPGLDLPDPDDRHVLAAAIHANAQAIVTSNVKDFPEEVLSLHHVEAITPDDFLVGLFDLNEAQVSRIIEQQLGALTSPPTSREELLESFERAGLVRLAALLNRSS